MNIIDRIFLEPELQAEPPVLVDVGAAGGVHSAWRRIARHAIGVGFEPDVRETGALSGTQRAFRRWVFCPNVAVPKSQPSGEQEFYLTRSPQCSSLLRPDQTGLAEWAFADQFEVLREEKLPAATLLEALHSAEVGRIDWIKFDTQGMDLQLYRSLPAEWRRALLVAEFEPGLIDAYRGEDQVAAILSAMKGEPFWLARLDVGRTPRGRRALLETILPMGDPSWARRLAPLAPAWMELQFQRDYAATPPMTDRRCWLLGWVFATITGQSGQALTIAEDGHKLFDELLWEDMANESRRRLRWAMVRNFPGWVWRRFGWRI